MSVSSIQTMIDYHCAACKKNNAKCNPDCYVKAAQAELNGLIAKPTPIVVEEEKQAELEIF